MRSRSSLAAPGRWPPSRSAGPRPTQRKARVVRVYDTALTDAAVSLAAEYGRYGYRWITALLRADGWRMHASEWSGWKQCFQRWREGLKVPRRQPKRGRLWLNDGSCIGLRPCWPGHVWAFDFVQDRTSDGWPFRMLTVIVEYMRESFVIVVARRLTSDDVLQALTDLFVERGPPDHIGSDNGGEFGAKIVDPRIALSARGSWRDICHSASAPLG
jgi:hypothetical protein